MGMDAWIAAHDERAPGAKAKQVPGVAPVYGGEQPGTPDTPAEGHTHMEPGPGEPGGPTAGHYVGPGSEENPRTNDKHAA